MIIAALCSSTLVLLQQQRFLLSVRSSGMTATPTWLHGRIKSDGTQHRIMSDSQSFRLNFRGQIWLSPPKELWARSTNILSNATPLSQQAYQASGYSKLFGTNFVPIKCWRQLTKTHVKLAEPWHNSHKTTMLATSVGYKSDGRSIYPNNPGIIW